MASDLAELEILCRETGLSKAAICNVLNSCDNARVILKDISEYVTREKAQKEKLINNVQSLRRARVNAGELRIFRSPGNLLEWPQGIPYSLLNLVVKDLQIALTDFTRNKCMHHSHHFV